MLGILGAINSQDIIRFLYEEGNEYISITGGWIQGYTEKFGYSEHPSEAYIQKNSDNILLYLFRFPEGSAGGEGEIAVSTFSPINLRNKKTLYIEYIDNGSANKFLAVGGNSTGSYNDSVEFKSLIYAPSKTIESLDISNINGDFYIRVHLYKNLTEAGGFLGTMNIYNIWVE